MFRLIGRTHPGAVREHNEDAFYCNEDQGIAVVADGMGGYAAGEVASRITVETLEELGPEANQLVAALVESHNRITAHADAHPESKGMGAAVVAAKLAPGQLSVCWAGDSRAYLYSRKAGLKPVSRDHSYVQWLLSQGQITETQARNHPERNLVTQCLGLKPPQPELTTVRWAGGDSLLLCSDGLTDELDDEEIADTLKHAESDEAGVQALVEAALEAGGKDNITVVLASNLAPPTPVQPEPAPEPASMQPRKDRGSTASPWLPIVLGIGAAALSAIVLFYWMRG